MADFGIAKLLWSSSSRFEGGRSAKDEHWRLEGDLYKRTGELWQPAGRIEVCFVLIGWNSVFTSIRVTQEAANGLYGNVQVKNSRGTDLRFGDGAGTIWADRESGKRRDEGRD